jgi:methyl-accepting chemotaxis protein
MAQSLAGVADDAHEVLRLREAVRGSQGRSADGGVLSRLEKSLERALRLVHDLEAAEAAAHEVGRSAEATAAGLARRIHSIRTIKTSIHQMALNAHLKCCRLGDAGRPLSVIAVELRVYADALGQTAEEAEALLADLAAAAAGEADEGAHCTSAEAGALLEAAMTPVRDAETRAGHDLAALVAKGEQMVGGLNQATGRLNFRGEVSDVLRDMAERLRAEAAPAETPDPATPALAEAMAEIAALYTMARERDIHRAFAEPQAAAAA